MCFCLNNEQVYVACWLVVHLTCTGIVALRFRFDYPNLLDLKKMRYSYKILYPNLKFEQLIISKFESMSDSSLGIQVLVVRIFELFRVLTNLHNRTVEF